MAYESPERDTRSGEERWKKTLEEIDHTKDRLGKPVDQGIKETVAALKCAGFETDASCEGHLDRKLKAPWIDLKFIPGELKERLQNARRSHRGSSPEETRLVEEAKLRLLSGEARILELLNEFYGGRQKDFQARLMLRFYPESARLLSQAAEVQDLYAREVQADKLKQFQEEMRVFTDFLREKFVSTPE